ncbi:MAG TPA: S9 family peptidase [Acidisarcina sp.]
MNLPRLQRTAALRGGVLLCLAIAAAAAIPGCEAPAQTTAPAGPPTTPPGREARQPGSDPRIAELLATLGAVRKIHQAAIAPDSRSVAWVVGGEHGSGRELMVALLRGDGRSSGTPVRLTVSEKSDLCDEEDLAWSPDSTSLAFLSDCRSPGQSDVYVADMNSKQTPVRLTHLHGYAHRLAWSPDGRQVSFLYVEGATRPAGALAAIKPFAGVIGEEGLEIQRVAAVNIERRESGAAGADNPAPLRQLTPSALHVFEFDWSPDSSRLAYIAAPPPGENNWWVAQLYTQPVANPADEGNAQSVVDPARVDGALHGLQIAVPRWSPDGNHIAFIGGLMSDQGATGGDLYLVAARGGAVQPLLGGPVTSPAPSPSPSPAPSPSASPSALKTSSKTSSKTSIAWFSWLSADHRASTSSILVSEIAAGSMQVANITFGMPSCLSETSSDGTPCDPSPKVLARRELMHSDATIGDDRLEGSLSLAADNAHVAFVSSSFSDPPEVWTGDLLAGSAGNVETGPVTHYNDNVKPAWGKAESLHWSDDGFNVQGWLTYPAAYDPAKKYPMIVLVHGGPASAVLPDWPGLGLTAAPFSALGYFVLQPNPRGSYGEGEAFTAANRKDFGYGDLRDILAGVDAVTSRYPVDPDRVGLTGWSYGGFMTMFAVTQTQRFRAAVAGAGISNWQSYYGQNSIDQWMVPYFGATVYDDPAVYARSSAINYIHQAKTPVLVVVGDRDGECPAPQSFEFWHALRAQHVPAQLVVYPSEGHGFVDPAHRIDVLTRALNWFDRYMQPRQNPTP